MPFIDNDAERIYFEDSGGPGPSVVLLHGFLLDRTSWARVVETLSPSYRVVTIDTRGHGMSSAGKEYTCSDAGEDVVAVLDELGIEKAVLAGLSQGGWTALRVTIAHPDRVSALLQVSTSVFPFEEAGAAAFRQMRDGWVEGGPLGDVLEGNLYAQFGPGRDEIKQPWIDKWQSRTPAEWSNPWSAILERLDESDRSERFAQVSCPVGFVHGDADVSFPVDAAHAGSKLFPDSRGVTVVPGAPHASAVTHPEEVAAAIKGFLDQLT